MLNKYYSTIHTEVDTPVSRCMNSHNIDKKALITVLILKMIQMEARPSDSTQLLNKGENYWIARLNS